MNKRGTTESLILAVLFGGIIVTGLIAGLNWNITPSVLIGLGAAVVAGALTQPLFKN